MADEKDSKDPNCVTQVVMYTRFKMNTRERGSNRLDMDVDVFENPSRASRLVVDRLALFLLMREIIEANVGECRK